MKGLMFDNDERPLKQLTATIASNIKNDMIFT
jgi:hypothetical protein